MTMQQAADVVYVGLLMCLPWLITMYVLVDLEVCQMTFITNLGHRQGMLITFGGHTL